MASGNEKLCKEDLEKMLEGTPLFISEKLLSLPGYLSLLDDANLKNRELKLIIKLLDKSYNSGSKDGKTLELLLATFQNSNFYRKLMNFASEMKYDFDSVHGYMPLLLNIIKEFLKLSPINGYPLVSSLFDICYGIADNLKTEHQSFVDSQKETLEYMKVLLDESRKTTKRMLNLELGSNYPPDNYRDLKIIPTCEELNLLRRPFLRPNIIKGKYESVEEYLDIQFRLMKEDFLRPLREGLQEYRKTMTRKNLNIRVYTNVYLDCVGIENEETVYYLRLQVRKKLLENSKRLMFGNVLLLSSDEFRTLIVATVCNRDYIKDHIITVKIEVEPFKLEKNKLYMVIESSSYFVSYKHTLKALQEITEIPLKEYIIDVNETNAPPDYLDNSSMYKINNEIIEMEHFKIKILDPIENFPSSTDLKLNPSQRLALYGALTRKIAVIQGPPGTGKTFLGLRITKILLDNKNIWNKEGKSPLLVVCYTNHALDQFLEGILDITHSICRVGSRSKCEALAFYNIKRLLRGCPQPKREQLRNLQNEICVGSEKMKLIKEPGIIHLKYFNNKLRSIIPDHLAKVIERTSMSEFLVGKNIKIPYLKTRRYMSSRLNFSTKIRCDMSSRLNFNTIEDNCGSGDDEDDLTEELRREEELQRNIDDNEDIDTNYKNTKNCTPWFEFEVTVEEIDDFLTKFKADESKITVCRNLKALLQAVLQSKKISFSKRECKMLEKRSIRLPLNLTDKWKLYKYWNFKLVIDLQIRLTTLGQKHTRLQKLANQEKLNNSKNAMKYVDVVGMTTTGASQNYEVLKSLAPPIVIVEEAAEIMESHVITSLSPECKHLILIGDHKQLRPKPNVYELGSKYNLDKSLFERMILNGIKYHTLEYQHRMRPEISSLLVPTLYENLKDHPSVQRYPSVKGVAKNLFFIDHNVFESPLIQGLDSYENPHEADFLMGLCQHLLFQDYKTENITILTPYLGQFLYFKKLQKRGDFDICKFVRVCILDNYQGEESDIILLSLVRSNENKKVGFMKIDNRVNVALSRAKHGMFIIGNMSQMAHASELWKKINQKLINQGNIGQALQLKCPNHPENLIEVKSLNEFLLKSPKGFCELPCGSMLPWCEHKCPLICHSFEHCVTKIKCKESCTKTCELGHSCPKLCYENCGNCEIFVEKLLPCGHTHSIKCHIPPVKYNCSTIMEKILPLCKHKKNVPCYEDVKNIKCKEPCTVRLDCGHQCKRKYCHPKNDPEHEVYLCQSSCERTVNCEFDHKCKKLCFKSCEPCDFYIDRLLKCGHTVKNIKCSVPEKDIICKDKCQRKLACGHDCPRLCYQDCGGCKEIVFKPVPSCGHLMKVFCNVSPSNLLCNKKCERTLPCGHLCTLKCIDKCFCTHLVESKVKCPKNHIFQIPCYLNRNISELACSNICLQEKTVGEYCREDCGETLECGHLCKGKCGECLNGRLHLACIENCNKILLCGHVCRSRCGEDCGPCKEKVTWKCSHREIKSNCSIRFITCKRPCTRGCIHAICTANCGSCCNIKPCTKPCRKKIKCGHKCIGYCGEKCPKMCWICDKEELNGNINDALSQNEERFVELEDCGHVFEGVWLDNWMTSKEEKRKINFKVCPKCGVPILNTKRYQNIILQNQKDIISIHSSYLKNRRILYNELFLNMKEQQNTWPKEVKLIKQNLNLDENYLPRGRFVEDREYVLSAFQLKFLKFLFSFNKVYAIREFISKIMRCKNVSHQSVNEFACELRRIETCQLLEKLQTHIKELKNEPPDVLEIINTVFNEIELLMNPAEKFDKHREEQIKLHLNELKQLTGLHEYALNLQPLKLSETLNLGAGNWFRCPKHHIYLDKDPKRESKVYYEDCRDHLGCKHIII